MLAIRHVLSWVRSLSLRYLHWSVFISGRHLCFDDRGSCAARVSILTGYVSLNQGRDLAFVDGSDARCGFRSLERGFQFNLLLLFP